MVSELKTVFFIWRLIGLSQLKFSQNKRGKFIFKISWMSVLYSFSILSAIAWSVANEFIEIISSKIFKSTNGLIMYCIDVFVVIVICASGIMLSFWNRNKLAKVLINLNNVKSTLMLQTRKNHNFTITVCVQLIILMIVLVDDYFIWSTLYNLEVSYILTYPCYLLILAMNLQFCYLVESIWEIHKYINDSFNNLLNDRSPIYFILPECRSREARMAQMTKLIKIYERLKPMTEDIDQQYGLQNLLMLAYFLEQMVCNPFFCIMNNDLFHHNRLGAPNFIILHSLWIICVFSQMFTLLSTCSKFKNEVLKLKHIIALNLNPIRSGLDQEHLKLLMLKLSDDYYGFSTLGIVQLDLSTLIAILASATTYLVIFLQF